MKLGVIFVCFFGSLLAFGCSSGSDDGEKGGAGGSASGSPGVACGPAGTCTAGQFCCVSLVGDPHTCASSCEGTTKQYACDGPEDCGGKPCCAVSGDVACSAGDTCGSDLRRCHTNSDCPNGAQCIPATLAEVPVDFCKP